MIVRFSNSLFLSQHCAVLCFFSEEAYRHYKSFVSLSKSNQESFFSRVVFLKTNLGFFLSRATSIFVKSVCMFVIGSNVNTADCLIFVFAFFLKKRNSFEERS